MTVAQRASISASAAVNSGIAATSVDARVSPGTWRSSTRTSSPSIRYSTIPGVLAARLRGPRPGSAGSEKVSDGAADRQGRSLRKRGGTGARDRWLPRAAGRRRTARSAAACRPRCTVRPDWLPPGNHSGLCRNRSRTCRGSLRASRRASPTARLPPAAPTRACPLLIPTKTQSAARVLASLPAWQNRLLVPMPTRRRMIRSPVTADVLPRGLSGLTDVVVAWQHQQRGVDPCRVARLAASRSCTESGSAITTSPVWTTKSGRISRC